MVEKAGDHARAAKEYELAAATASNPELRKTAKTRSRRSSRSTKSERSSAGPFARWSYFITESKIRSSSSSDP